ncbi:MAG: hypothetical protein PHU95_00680 [Candidatus Thermoplasmatota archaeon]|nr:hypothetical protein [Candidatus Thermoplasmatota archaeon]MDD5777952.1 hypothetical protein [Candidatus Thermoplasmatota archaeon]
MTFTDQELWVVTDNLDGTVTLSFRDQVLHPEEIDMLLQRAKKEIGSQVKEGKPLSWYWPIILKRLPKHQVLSSDQMDILIYFDSEWPPDFYTVNNGNAWQGTIPGVAPQVFRYCSLSPPQVDFYLGVCVSCVRDAVEVDDPATNCAYMLLTMARNQDLSEDNIWRILREYGLRDQWFSSQRRAPEMTLDILATLYEHQTLTPEQVSYALELGVNMDILMSYQTLTPEHLDRAIELGVDLDILYANPNLTAEQRTRLLKKMGLAVPEVALDHPLWKAVSPKLIPKAIQHLKEATERRLPVSPLDSLLGVYTVEKTTRDVIREWLNEQKSMYMKEGDDKYAYYTDDKGKEHGISIGKILTRAGEHDLLKRYSKLRQLGEPEGGDLEIVISKEPEDIARKSTGQKWTSCETVGASHGWPPRCGWCDDIRANNLIAYIRHRPKSSGEDTLFLPTERAHYPGDIPWLGRMMIRWCLREDDNQPDAYLENYYGDPKYSDTLRNRLIEILRQAGFSGVRGNVACVTPYSYGGYIDSGAHMDEQKWMDWLSGLDTETHSLVRMLATWDRIPKHFLRSSFIPSKTSLPRDKQDEEFDFFWRALEREGWIEDDALVIGNRYDEFVKKYGDALFNAHPPFEVPHAIVYNVGDRPNPGRGEPPTPTGYPSNTRHPSNYGAVAGGVAILGCMIGLMWLTRKKHPP